MPKLLLLTSSLAWKVIPSDGGESDKTHLKHAWFGSTMPLPRGSARSSERPPPPAIFASLKPQQLFRRLAVFSMTVPTMVVSLMIQTLLWRWPEWWDALHY